jgi:hypothetical protein
MNLPRNVFRFEVLLYASLMLDSLSVAVQDRTPTADMTDQMIMLATLVTGGMILLFLFFVGSRRATARTGRAGCWRHS